MSPDSQDRVAPAGVELGDDEDLHQRWWVVSVRPASRAPRYGRSARKARASATAASREYASAAGAARWRMDTASSTPQRHPCARARAAQWASKPQPIRSSGKGSNTGKVAWANAVTG